MATPSQVRDILQLTKEMAQFLTDDEIQKLGVFYLGVLARVAKEGIE